MNPSALDVVVIVMIGTAFLVTWSLVVLAGLKRPKPATAFVLTTEYDEHDGWIVTDDFSTVYGNSDVSEEEAVVDYVTSLCEHIRLAARHRRRLGKR